MTSVQAAKSIQRQGEIFLSLGIAYACTLIPINRKKHFGPTHWDFDASKGK
jgi:hypothetical protein